MTIDDTPAREPATPAVSNGHAVGCHDLDVYADPFDDGLESVSSARFPVTCCIGKYSAPVSQT